jgi:Trk-type K+ transport system membrane component
MSGFIVVKYEQTLPGENDGEAARMTGLYLLLPRLLTIFASFLVVRAGAIELRMTGMDAEKASFQALSAFTRTGFSTREAELVLNNRQRRRIVTWLIILGNAGLIAIIVTATSSIATSSGYKLPITIGALLVGTYLLYRLMKRKGFVRKWESFVENRFVKSRIIKEATTEDLLNLIEGYGLERVIII